MPAVTSARSFARTMGPGGGVDGVGVGLGFGVGAGLGAGESSLPSHAAVNSSNDAIPTEAILDLLMSASLGRWLPSVSCN
jgi:hypothetical protein